MCCSGRRIDIDFVGCISISDKSCTGSSYASRKLNITIFICSTGTCIRGFAGDDSKCIRTGDNAVKVPGVLLNREVPESLPATRKSDIRRQGVIRIADVNVWGIVDRQVCSRGHIKHRPRQPVDYNFPSACRVLKHAGVGVGGGESVGSKRLTVEVKGALSEGKRLRGLCNR